MKTNQKPGFFPIPTRFIFVMALIWAGLIGQTAHGLTLSLQVHVKGTAVELAWPSEPEAPAYYVERYDSIAGEFRAVAWLKNLTQPNETMHFTDRSVNCGQYAYQLRVVDNTGRTYLSDIQTVVVEKGSRHYDPDQPPVVKLRDDKTYPALIITNVQTNQITKLSIISPGEGRILNIKPQLEPHKIVIGIHHLTKGTYALAFTANGQQYMERFRVD